MKVPFYPFLILYSMVPLLLFFFSLVQKENDHVDIVVVQDVDKVKESACFERLGRIFFCQLVRVLKGFVPSVY